MTMQENFPRPETRSARFSRAFQSGRQSWAAWWQERRDGRLWASAEGFEDLCELTARFCEGLLRCAPGHGGSRDEETVEIADELAHANRAGFLTINSQPGVDPVPEEHYHEQRAWVEGFASKKVMNRLKRLTQGTRLVIHAKPMRRWRKQDLYGREGLDTTRDAHRVHSGIGSLPSIRNVRSGISFGGACAPEAVREVENSYFVLILDPEWGNRRLLWDTLAKL